MKSNSTLDFPLLRRLFLSWASVSGHADTINTERETCLDAIEIIDVFFVAHAGIPGIRLEIKTLLSEPECVGRMIGDDCVQRDDEFSELLVDINTKLQYLLASGRHRVIRASLVDVDITPGGLLDCVRKLVGESVWSDMERAVISIATNPVDVHRARSKI